MNGEGFRTDLFTEPEHYEEGPLRDRKAEIPDLHRPDKKAEFIRDVIALANTARMFGKPAYLLFGINDDGKLCGVESTLGPYRQGSEPTHKTWERVKQQMGHAIRHNIRPIPKFDLKHDIIGGKEIAYLLIAPIPSQEPFQVNSDLRQGGQVYLSKGQCWIRFGESKHEIQAKEISPDQAPYAYSYAQVPFLIPSNWQRYFEGVLSDQAIARAQQIKAYQELITSRTKLLQEEVSEFLENTLRILVIIGVAGSGKSAFIRRLTGKWAEYGLAAMKEAVRREEFIAPSDWIPVYFPLRGCRLGDLQTLNDELLNRINSIGNIWDERPQEPERLFEYPRLRWLICLDGLDEIWEDDSQARFLSTMRSFTDRFPRVKIILTTRPTMTGLEWEGWPGKAVEIAPLSSEQITKYIANFVDSEQYDEVIKALQSESDLWQLCSIPAYLEAAIEELAGVYPVPLEDIQLPPEEISEVSDISAISPAPPESINPPKPVEDEDLMLSEPITSEREESTAKVGIAEEASQPGVVPIRIGVLLDRIYQHLWAREENRQPLPIGYTDEWWEKTGELAVKVNGRSIDFKRHQALEVLSSDECLYWITFLNILRRMAINKWRFYTELTKVYFAASFLLSFVEGQRYDEGHQLIPHITQDFQSKLCSILSELTAADINSLFQGGCHDHNTV
jgi:hypothetical protein